VFGAPKSIRWVGGPFRVAGWQPGPEPSDGWASIFRLYAGPGEDLPPVAGTYSVEHGALTFRPRYPLGAGMKVRAVFESKEIVFDLPRATPLPATTRVRQVYPSTDVLPENQLKLYVYFTAPMQIGQAWTNIHLRDESGKPVDLPFLEIDQELWNRDQTRLTVLFDPGRIKRGVLPLNEVGPSIQAGKRYTLVVDRTWLDSRGAPLVEEHRKEFRVGPADRTPIDTANWKVTPPRAGTSEPLVIVFPEPLDYAMLQHAIEVRGVAGKIDVQRGETEWRFTPDQPWKSGSHEIVVPTNLEDLAGNKVGRAFDVDVFEKVTRTVERETVSLPFRTRPQ
jgi:hypothetical protein